MIDKSDKCRDQLKQKISKTKAEASQYDKVMTGVIVATAALSAILPFITVVAVPLLAGLILEAETVALPLIIAPPVAIFGIMAATIAAEVRVKGAKQKEFEQKIENLNQEQEALIEGYKRTKMREITESSIEQNKEQEQEKSKKDRAHEAESEKQHEGKSDFKKIQLNIKSHAKQKDKSKKASKYSKYNAKSYYVGSKKDSKAEEKVDKLESGSALVKAAISSNETPTEYENKASKRSFSDKVTPKKLTPELFKSKKSEIKKVFFKKPDIKEKWDKGKWDKLKPPKSKVEKIEKKRKNAAKNKATGKSRGG